ncbi:MAG: ATP-binding protein [Rhodospirillaceae bacterium]|nr:ATP-binding protein [Rhodospirillaceae bacterium]
MTGTETDTTPREQLLETPDLSGALESERFKQFLDHVPVAIAVATLERQKLITYANLEFERLTGMSAVAMQGRPWTALPGDAAAKDDGRGLSDAIKGDEDFIGVFEIILAGKPMMVNAWSNIIVDDHGTPTFRLVALAEVKGADQPDHEELQQRLAEKDVLLLELQHRVKNNLQMITALIRLEARNIQDDGTGKKFERLAGRVNSLALLYRSLSDDGKGDSVDLGIYLSQIASAVMTAHAVEGIRLDLKVDTWPVSINVAMPAGLVVNELLTNALKHAFTGRDGGTITLHALVDETGCKVIVADDGIGLDDAQSWPKPGKLSALILQSLRQNAKASVDILSLPGKGLRVTLFFARASAAPADA